MFSNRKIFLVIILLVTFSASAYVLLVLIPRRLAEQSYEGARKIGSDLRKALQFTPEITVNSRIIVEQQADVLELATLSQRFHRTYTWTNTRLGSTKAIELSGTFELKAGFDLNQEFHINIEDGKATVFFPTPRVLSVESLGDIEFRDENGLWNWLNGQDRSQAINAYTRDARQYAEEILSMKPARELVSKKVTTIIKTHVREVEIRVAGKRIGTESGDYVD
jgi:Protein of unknown function (DUF4230)